MIKTILSTVVGSNAHGTSGPDSDTDLRSVFIAPTDTIVGIGNYQKSIENKQADENAWEVAHFIYLSLRCNPSTLECLLAPPTLSTEEGEELRNLFPHFLSKKLVYGAFRGFATQQRAKMISPTTNYFRKEKASSHFLRVIYNGLELLQTGTFTIKIVDTPIGRACLEAKQGKLLFEEILQLGDDLVVKMDETYEKSNLPKEANKEVINRFLVKIRKSNWLGE